GGYRKLPAPPDARNIDVVLAGRLPSAEIGRLDPVAGIRIVDGSGQLAAKCNGSIDVAQREFGGWASGCYQGHLRHSGQVTHLVHLDHWTHKRSGCAPRRAQRRKGEWFFDDI